MRRLRSFLFLGLNLFSRRRFERRLSIELDANLDLLIEDKIRSGLSPAAARRDALLEFGGIEQVKEQVRQVRAGYQVENLIGDCRCAFRSLRRTPGFAIIAIFALAISGAAAGISFSLSYFLLAQSIRFPNPGELVQISERSTESGLQAADVSLPKFQALRAKSGLPDVGAYTAESVTLKKAQDVIQASGARVTEGLLDLLGVQPEQGKLLGLAKDGVLLSHRFWMDRFAGDETVIGQPIAINGKQYTIVGVLGADLSPPLADFDLIRNGIEEIDFFNREQIQRGAGYLRVIARSPTHEKERLRQGLQSADESYQRNCPNNMDARFVSGASNLAESVTREVRPFLYALCSSVGGLFLLACINICCLFLTRLNAHHHELAIRAALGAEYRRIIQHVGCEVLILVFGGFVLALLLSITGLQLLPLAKPPYLPRWFVTPLTIGSVFILFGVATCFLTLAAAIQTARWYRRASKKSGFFSPDLHPLRSISGGFVAGQIAISLILILAAALLWSSLRQIQRSAPGFDPNDLFVSKMSLDPSRYQSPAEYRDLVDEVLNNLSGLSEVERAATVYGLPFANDDTYILCNALARQKSATRDWPTAFYRVVSPLYFETLRIPIIAGRSFNSRDIAGSPPVVILSVAAARALFPGADPIGQKIICGGTVRSVHEVVGIAGDVRPSGLTRPERGETYFPVYQQSEPMIRLVIRTASMSEDQRSLFGQTVTQRLKILNPEQPLLEFETMEQLVAQSVLHQKQLALVLEVLASLAVILTMVGVYSVVRFAVIEKQREIAVRLALGASRRNILHLVLARGFRLIFAGVLTGTLVAPLVKSSLSRLLTNDGPIDPLLLAGSVFGLILFSLIALCLPARRAILTDPMIALRV